MKVKISNRQRLDASRERGFSLPELMTSMTIILVWRQVFCRAISSGCGCTK